MLSSFSGLSHSAVAIMAMATVVAMIIPIMIKKCIFEKLDMVLRCI